MSISNEINRLEQAKQDIKDAMQAKGITVPSDATLDEYAELLASMIVDIPFGGTGATTASQARTNLGITPDNIGASAANHSHSNASTSAAGFLPKLGGGTTNYLRADGTWAKPPNTTYANMKGASSSAAGSSGLVPAPAAGKQTSFLRGDGTWVVPTNTTYSNMSGATTSAAGKAGLVPAPSAGAATRYLRSDGTWQVPPDTNTTYGVATSSANGLMSATDKKKLDTLEETSAISTSFIESLF